MIIKVYLHTILQRQTSQGLISQIDENLDPGSKVADLVHKLGIQLDADELLIVINGHAVDLDSEVKEGDQVHLIPAISGG